MNFDAIPSETIADVATQLEGRGYKARWFEGIRNEGYREDGRMWHVTVMFPNSSVEFNDDGSVVPSIDVSLTFSFNLQHMMSSADMLADLIDSNLLNTKGVSCITEEQLLSHALENTGGA